MHRPPGQGRTELLEAENGETDDEVGKELQVFWGSFFDILTPLKKNEPRYYFSNHHGRCDRGWPDSRSVDATHSRRLREKQRRKLALFRDLLKSRAIPMSLSHVQALNTIELEFYPRRGKNTRVIDAWRVYCNHLNQPTITDQALIQGWTTDEKI